MSAWIQKLTQFKTLLDTKAGEHKSSPKKVKTNLRSIAESAASVQPRMLFELALVEPQLAQIKDDGSLCHATVYDTIQYNLVELLIEEGTAHLENM